MDLTKFTDEELAVHFERLACMIAVERSAQADADEEVIRYGHALVRAGEDYARYGSKLHGAATASIVALVFTHEKRQMELAAEINVALAELERRKAVQG